MRARAHEPRTRAHACSNTRAYMGAIARATPIQCIQTRLQYQGGWVGTQNSAASRRSGTIARAPRQSVERSHTPQILKAPNSVECRIVEALDLSAPPPCCARILPFRVNMLTPPAHADAPCAEGRMPEPLPLCPYPPRDSHTVCWFALETSL